MIESRRSCAGSAGWGPSVAVGVISTASVKNRADVGSTPDNHFAARPDCGVNEAGSWGVGDTGSYPTVQAGIVPSACVQDGGVVVPPQTIILLPVQTAV